MQQIVSITSQGQITIPASIRRLLGLDKYPKASIRAEGKKIIIEPVPNILSLGGLLKDKSIKEKSIDEVIRLEKEAVSKAFSKKYLQRKK